jgi:outer membrane protein assembly factor BamD (BamD/ComL family)
MAAMSRIALSLALLLSLIGCAGSPDPRPTPVTLELAPITSADSVGTDPRELQARELMASGDYESARLAYRTLARSEPDPMVRAEYLFFSAEAALGAGDDYAAYETYRVLVQQYPNAPRFPLVIERLFLIGRRYCEGIAVKPSWLMGIDMSDREFGVKLLESFQKARERHPLADDALHYMAVANEAMGEYELAIEAWQRLGKLYPRREWVETAEYRSALVFLAMSDGVAYDKRPLITGLTRLRRYVQRYPQGDYVAEAEQHVTTLEADLADHLLGVAKFYIRRDRNYSADIYLAAVVREYPDTPAAVDAQRLKDSLPASSPPPPKDPEDGLFGERFRRLLNPTPPAPLPVD